MRYCFYYAEVYAQARLYEVFAVARYRRSFYVQSGVRYAVDVLQLRGYDVERLTLA